MDWISFSTYTGGKEKGDCKNITISRVGAAFKKDYRREKEVFNSILSGDVYILYEDKELSSSEIRIKIRINMTARREDWISIDGILEEKGHIDIFVSTACIGREKKDG